MDTSSTNLPQQTKVNDLHNYEVSLSLGLLKELVPHLEVNAFLIEDIEYVLLSMTGCDFEQHCLYHKGQCVADDEDDVDNKFNTDCRAKADEEGITFHQAVARVLWMKIKDL